MSTTQRVQTALLAAILCVAMSVGLLIYSQRDRPWSDTKCFEVALKLDAGMQTVSQDLFAEECL
jgi:hypothetical protein